MSRTTIRLRRDAQLTSNPGAEMAESLSREEPLSPDVSGQTNPALDPPTEPPTDPPDAFPEKRASPPPRRRRRWPYVVGGILLLLILLVVFAPTIASTAWVRNIILGRVNDNLNGRLEVADWSLGWGSGVKMSGVRLFDAENAQILEMRSVTTELTLWDAIRGRYHVGKVVVDGLDALVKTDAEGDVNFAKVPKADPAKAEDQPTTIPDLRGELHLVNSRATYEDRRSPENGGTGETFHFPSIAGQVKFPDINEAISNALEVTVRVGDQPPGSIVLAGSMDLIENNEIRLDQAAIDQKLQIKNLELASTSFALPKDGGIQTISGVSDGTVVVSVQKQGDATLDLNLTTSDFAVGGPALNGDTYRTKTLALAAPNIVINRSAAPDDISQWTVRAGSGGQGVQLKVDQGTASVTADAPVKALQNLAANLAPGASGFVRAQVDMDAAALQQQMPNLIALREGMQLTSGRVRQVLDLNLAPDRAELKTFDLNITEVAGRDAERDANFELEPVRLSMQATSFGGGQAVPDLRDLKLTIDSAFANGTIEGRSIAETNGRLTADLQKAHDELVKLFDFDDADMSGTLVLDIESRGDFVAERRATVGVTLAGDNLELSGIPGAPVLREPRLRAKTNVVVLGGEEDFLQGLRDLTLTAQAGDEQRPTLDANLAAAVIDLDRTAPAVDGAAAAGKSVAAEGVELKRLLVDLSEAQQKYGDLVPALKETALRLENGTVNITGAGSYDGAAAAYTARIALADATVHRATNPVAPATPAEPAPTARPVVSDYDLTIDAAGTYAAQDEQRSQITLTTLSGKDNLGTSFAKAGERDLVILMTPEGIVPTGTLAVGADLRQASDVWAAMGDATTAEATGLQSGKLAGNIQVQPFEAGQFRVAGDLKVTNLTVTGEGGEAVRDEELAIDLQARPRSDFSAIAIDRLNVNGRLLTVNTETAQIQLTVGEGDAARATTLPEMVQALRMTVAVPDLGQIQALLDAFAPAEAPVALVPGTPLPEALVLARDEVDPGAVISRPADRPRQRRPDQPDEPVADAPEATEAPDAAEAPDAPAPPIRFTGGRMDIALTLSRDGERYVFTPEITGKDVAIAKGEATSTIDDLSLKTAMSYVPVPPPAAPTPDPATPAQASPEQPPLAELVRDLRVPRLELSATSGGAPIINLSLAEPFAVSEPAALASLFATLTDPTAEAGDVPTVRTALIGNGDLGELMALLKTLQADASTDRPYAGAYRLNQNFAAGKDGIAASGDISIADFSAKGENGTITEKSIRLANDIRLDANQKVLSIRNVSLAMEATKALELTLKGAIHEFDTTRRLEGVEGTLSYDWAQVWQMVEPMLDEETREGLELAVAGKGSERFWFTGSLPADQPFKQAIQSLAGGLQVHFDSIIYDGLTIERLQLPLTLDKGIATIAFPGKSGAESLPPPAECNGGAVNIAGAAFDLTTDILRLNFPKGQKLLDNVTLNPVFSDRFGNIINNPAFINPSEASGIVNITVVQADQFPLGALDPAVARRDPGRAEFLVSMSRLQLGNPMIAQVARWAGQEDFVESLHGEIREARIVMEKGLTKQDLTIVTGDKGRQLRIAGSTVMATGELDLTLTIGPQFLRQLGSDVVKALPNGLPVPLTGTAQAPRFDMQRALMAAVGENLIPNLLDRIGKRTQGSPDGDDDKDTAAPADPVGGVLDDLFNRKKETDEEKRLRREQRRREREQEREQQKQPPATNPPPSEAVDGDTPIGKPAPARADDDRPRNRRNRDRRR